MRAHRVHPTLLAAVLLSLSMTFASGCSSSRAVAPAATEVVQPPSTVVPPAPSVPAALSPDAALGKRLDGALDAALADRRIVGGIVIVVRDGKVVYHRAAGLADREKNTPLREDALFRYASVSKPIVAVAALALVDHGVLGLDDPVTRWLPDFAPRTEGGKQAVITVRQLLTHTSGLGYAFEEPAPGGPYRRAKVSDGTDQPGLSFAENQKRLASVPLRSAPGTRFEYGLSIDVLGEVVARAAKAPLPEAVSRLVTGPLGMKETGFVVNDPSRLTAAYAPAPGGPALMKDDTLVPLGPGHVVFSPSRVLDPRSYPSGGAGMVGSAGDLVTFLEAMRTGGRGVVKPATAQLMTENQLGRADATFVGPGRGFGFVSAVVVDPAQAKTSLSRGTWAWGGVYGHSWLVDPTRRITAVVMTNTALEGMNGKLADDVERAVSERGPS